MTPTTDYRYRLLDQVLDKLLAQVSAVLFTGPRECGKALARGARAPSEEQRTLVRAAEKAGRGTGRCLGP
jgi:hypothetical protein